MCESLAESIATETLRATLGEYDALWDGELFPEIVDAEFHDCDPEQPSAVLPLELFTCYDRKLAQDLERLEALVALMGAVSAMVENSLDVPLFDIGVDGEMFDCPLDPDTFFDCYVDPDLN